MKIEKYKLVITVMMLFSAQLFSQTAGTLTFSYNQPQPTNPAPNSGIKNIYAVWIESATGSFIKTKARFVSTSTDDHLPTWGAKAGCASAVAVAATNNGCSVTDATTGATRTASTTPTAFGTKSITWDAKNVVGTVNGTTVADGNYVVWVESSWVDSGSNNHGTIASFTFTKGPTAVHLTPNSPSSFLNTVVLDWVPTPLENQDFSVKEPAVVIYPVPSTGLFKIDIKNDLKSIKVYNLLGEQVYYEALADKNTANTTKEVNLNDLAAGDYVIRLENDFGISNYEIIIKK